MAIKDILAKGIGFAPGGTTFIPTHGFGGVAAVTLGPRANMLLSAAVLAPVRGVASGASPVRVLVSGMPAGTYVALGRTYGEGTYGSGTYGGGGDEVYVPGQLDGSAVLA